MNTYFDKGKLVIPKPGFNTDLKYPSNGLDKKGKAIRQIYIHHTAGSSPSEKFHVNFQIGGKLRDQSQDGIIYHTLDHQKKVTCHLGVARGTSKNYIADPNQGLADLNDGVPKQNHLTESPILDYYDASNSKDRGCDFDRDTVGIEIINFGWVKKEGTKWKSYLDTDLDIKDTDVITYGYASTERKHKKTKGYRQETHYLKYTPKQIAALKRLLVFLALENDIPLKNEKEAIFQLNRSALTKKPGIYTHSSVRIDKYDCHPQPELIQMLKEVDALGYAIEFITAVRTSILENFPIEDWVERGWLASEEEAEMGVDRLLDTLVKSYVARKDLTQVEREIIQKYIQPEVIGEAAAMAEKLFFALSAANYREFLESHQ